MDKHATNEAMTVISSLALVKAEQLVELRKPFPVWPMKAYWFPAMLFTLFLTTGAKEPAWLNNGILIGSFFATIACFEVAISRLHKRVEALTSLLLEQHDG